MIREETFIRLFVRHEAELRGFAISLIPSVADAQDVVQDACIAMWRSKLVFSEELVERTLKRPGRKPIACGRNTGHSRNAWSACRPGGGAEEPPYEGYSPVESAQLRTLGDKPKNLLSTDTRPFWKPVEVSPRTMGYHWNHSAYSCFMVGNALADDMIKLLTP